MARCRAKRNCCSCITVPKINTGLTQGVAFLPATPKPAGFNPDRAKSASTVLYFVFAVFGAAWSGWKVESVTVFLMLIPMILALLASRHFERKAAASRWLRETERANRDDL